MRLKNDSFLLSTPIAHRGLWNENIIENSMEAYENAVKNGYPIEIDLSSSTDGEIFCFHDQTLIRMTGEEGYIFEKSSSEIRALRLSGSDQRIPSFDELLSLVDGKVPLLIELKDQPNKNYVKIVVEKLKKYKGEFALQSFNPILMYKVKKLAPEFIRGILTNASTSKIKTKFTKWVIKTMPLNFLIKPDFISCCYKDLNLHKKKTTPIITWTITSKEIKDSLPPFAKNIIFEHFIP